MTKWILVAATAAALACAEGRGPAEAPQTPVGSVTWSRAVDWLGSVLPIGAGADAQGNRYVLSYGVDQSGGRRHKLTLLRFDPGGQLSSTKEWTAEGWPAGEWGYHVLMAVTPDGGVYVAVNAVCSSSEVCVRCIDFGGGAATDTVLAKLGSDGSFEWQRELTGAHVWSMAANERGNVLIARNPRWQSETTLEQYQPEGALLRAVEAHGVADVALDRDGNMIALDRYGFLTKYAPDGSVAWDEPLLADAGPYEVETSGDGAVLVLGIPRSDIVVGGSHLRGGSFAACVLEADGALRFARALPSFADVLGWLPAIDVPHLAIDRTGGVAVVGTDTCGRIVVEAFDLSNSDLWRRVLPDDGGCWPRLIPGPASYADQGLLFAATFSQTVAIGGESWTPRGGSVIAVLLGP